MAPTAASASWRVAYIGSWRSRAVTSNARRWDPVGQAIASRRPSASRRRNALSSKAMPEESISETASRSMMTARAGVRRAAFSSA